MKKNNKKYIAIFSAYYYPHLGGIERYIDGMMRYLIKAGYSPLLITSNYNNTLTEEVINGIRIFRLPVYNCFKNRYPIIKHDRKYNNIIKKLDNYNISSIIVNTRFHLTSHIGALYGKKHNIPVYLVEHGSNYVTLDNKFIDFFANRYEDYLTWKIKKKIKGFYGVSNIAGRWLKKFNIKYSGVWYNSIDTNQIIPKRIKQKNLNFLYAGRLIKQKGIDNVLEAFEILNKEYHNIHMFIAGDGPEFEYLRNKYQNKNIEFLGKLSYLDLCNYYVKTEIFLYPPLWPEGLPTSILEAGLMGCSVIGTNQGGITEIIEDKINGIICDGSVESLVESMKVLIDNEMLRKKYSKELNKTIKDKFSWENTVKVIINDIEEK